MDKESKKNSLFSFFYAFLLLFLLLFCYFSCIIQKNVVPLHRLFKNNAICNHENDHQKRADNSKRLQNVCKDNTKI